MTCKECIHENLCVIKAYPDAFENTKWEKEPCDHFKPKSRFIELLCNVGDKVYENYGNRIFEYVVTSIEIFSPYDILYKVQSTEPWNRWVRFIGFNKQGIGKTIFLTREEAEKALAERSKK